MANKNLQKAKKAKNDEFYTQMSDIENELKHYKNHFKGKTVFCNCDDPTESNFTLYFAQNFEHLGLKKLMSTHYDENGRAMYIELDGDLNGDGKISKDDLMYASYPLGGNGDFRSEESIEMLKEADIVVTNPPFSLFREYIAQLIEYDKKFLVVGTIQAITYKEIFPLIKGNKMWLGNGGNISMKFRMPDNYEGEVSGDGFKYGKVPGISWWTNIDHKKRHEDLILYKSYNTDDYPKYDDYDAINVDKTSDIPFNYTGPMGVPISFLPKHNPSQFEILGNLGSYGVDGYSLASAIYIDGKKKFKRILIKRK